MRCPDCMSESFSSGLYDIGDIFNDEPIVIRNVAGAKCDQCGFLLLPASIAKEISKALALGLSSRSVTARLFDLAEVDVAAMLEAMPVDSRTPDVGNISPPPVSTPVVAREEASNLNVV